MAQAPDTAVFGSAADLRRPVASGNLLCVAAVLAWAAGFPAAEVLLQTWPTLSLVAARLVLAVGFLVVVWAALEGPHAVFRARWGRGMVVGGVCFGFGTWLLLIGQALTDAVTVAIFASTLPLVATLIEIALDGRRLNLGFVLGLAAALAGGIIATGNVAPGDIGLGALAVLASGLLFAWGSRTAIRDFPDLSQVGRTTVTLGGAMVVACGLCIGAWVLDFSVMPGAPVDASQLAMLAFYAVGAMALSLVLWFAAVGRLGVALASFHMNVGPFYVMLIMLALGATWSWPQAIGAAIVGLGVVLAQR